jgi:hypothetical protein
MLVFLFATAHLLCAENLRSYVAQVNSLANMYILQMLSMCKMFVGVIPTNLTFYAYVLLYLDFLIIVLCILCVFFVRSCVLIVLDV